MAVRDDLEDKGLGEAEVEVGQSKVSDMPSRCIIRDGLVIRV